MVSVLIAGGGTGGHVFPMVAVGDALRAERPDATVVYVGTGRGIESRVMGERGDALELLDVLPLRGRGLTGFVRGALRATAVIPEARALVRRLRPDVVFSVGGYAAGPVALAARSLGVAVTLLEPNAVPGFTNRLLGPLCTRVYVGFPEVAGAFRRAAVRWTGVPLRRRFERVPYRATVGETRVLVLGGSQGARGLNETLPEAVAGCLRRGLLLRVTHQAGRDKEVDVRRHYATLGAGRAVEVVAFIDDVAAALGATDIVVARSGASSCAELCAIGRAAVLIPYPFAADDHQRRNAESIARAGGAIGIAQGKGCAEQVERALEELCADPARRERMAECAAERGKPDAARQVALDLLSLAARSRHGTARAEETRV